MNKKQILTATMTILLAVSSLSFSAKNTETLIKKSNHLSLIRKKITKMAVSTFTSTITLIASFIIFCAIVNMFSKKSKPESNNKDSTAINKKYKNAFSGEKNKPGGTFIPNNKKNIREARIKNLFKEEKDPKKIKTKTKKWLLGLI